MSLVRFEWLCGVRRVKPIAYYGRVRGIPVVWARKGGIPVGNEVDDGFHIVGCGCPVWWWPGYEDFAEIGCRAGKVGGFKRIDGMG